MAPENNPKKGVYVTMTTDNTEKKTIRAYGLETRTWTFNEKNGKYGCAECCIGDRCDEDCDAPYKGRRKACPHCKGTGWIPKSDIDAGKPDYPAPNTEKKATDKVHIYNREEGLYWGRRHEGLTDNPENIGIYTRDFAEYQVEGNQYLEIRDLPAPLPKDGEEKCSTCNNEYPQYCSNPSHLPAPAEMSAEEYLQQRVAENETPLGAILSEYICRTYAAYREKEAVEKHLRAFARQEGVRTGHPESTPQRAESYIKNNLKG